jgi:hypothetical protein
MFNCEHPAVRVVRYNLLFWPLILFVNRVVCRDRPRYVLAQSGDPIRFIDLEFVGQWKVERCIRD